MLKIGSIVGTLSIVVLVFIFGVFLVEGITTPIINDANAVAANAAKAEVLPSIADYSQAVENTVDDYDVADTGITAIFIYPGYGYVYQAEFQGYQSVIVYMIGINEDGEVTGYKTLQQGDTPGLGAEIGNPVNWEQFMGMSLEDASSGNFDGLSGATVTTTGWKSSLTKVINFHNNEMLGFVVTDVTSSLTLPDSITKVEVISDGTTDLQVVYTGSFTGYSSTASIYTLTINLVDGSVKKLVIDEINETVGIGADINSPDFLDQFSNMSQTDALDGNYDVQAGASYPITLTGFSTSLEEIIIFHKVEYEGYVIPVETDAEKLARYKEEISVEDATFTDVTGDYDVTDSVITKVELANDGTEDGAVIFTVEFVGYNAGSPIEAMFGIDLDSNKIIGFRVLSENDTPGLGGEIDSEEFMAQFDHLTYLAAQYGVFDALSGATVTTDGLIDAFDDAIGFYRVEFLGEGAVVEETYAQKLTRYVQEIFPEAFSIANVSSEYTLSNDVTKVLRVNDLDDNLLGYVFIAKADGAGYTGGSFVEFMIGINEDKTFAGFRMLDDDETPGKGDPYYLLAYQEQFIGVDIEVLEYDIDEVAGATDTHASILDAAENVAKFFVEEVLNQVWARPASLVVDDADLLLAYPGADSFVSVYEAMPYSEFIANIYEVTDNSTVVGYIYIGQASGNSASTPITFAWGVNLAGNTQTVAILEHGETWTGALNCGEYCTPQYTGGSGIFPDTPWLATQFEAIVLAEVLTTNGIDDIAGVSNTTSGMREAAEAIAQYHSDNSVGGGS